MKIKLPMADEIKLGDPVVLFDGRYAELTSEPRRSEPIGLWAKVREVLNAKDPNFSYPDFGPEEKVSLAGAVNALSAEARRGPERSSGRARFKPWALQGG